MGPQFVLRDQVLEKINTGSWVWASVSAHQHWHTLCLVMQAHAVPWPGGLSLEAERPQDCLILDSSHPNSESHKPLYKTLQVFCYRNRQLIQLRVIFIFYMIYKCYLWFTNAISFLLCWQYYLKKKLKFQWRQTSLIVVVICTFGDTSKKPWLIQGPKCLLLY